MPAPNRRIIAVRVIVSVALVVAILAKVGPARILGTARGARPVPLVAALALAFPRLAVKTARWKVLAGRVVPVRWGLALRSLLVGTAGAALTPGRLGQATSSLLFPPGSRLLLSGMALTDPFADLGITVVLVAFTLGGVVPGAALLVGMTAAASLAPRIGLALSRKGGRMGSLGNALALLDARTVGLVAVLSAAIYAFNLVQFHLLLNAHERVPFVAAAESLPLIFLAVAFPVTISGFGLREAASALALARWGVDAGVAVRASFELFVVNLLLPALAGAVLASRLGIKTREDALPSQTVEPEPGETSTPHGSPLS